MTGGIRAIPVLAGIGWRARLPYWRYKSLDGDYDEDVGLIIGVFMANRIVFFILLIIFASLGYFMAGQARSDRDLYVAIGMPTLVFLFSYAWYYNLIGSVINYKKEVKRFAAQVYKEMKANGCSESEARMRSMQAASDYHQQNVQAAQQGLRSIPDEFMPKTKRKWLSINDILGRR